MFISDYSAYSSKESESCRFEIYMEMNISKSELPCRKNIDFTYLN